MNTVTFLFLFVVPLILFALALWRIFWQNRVHVPPGDIEWVVMENAVSGNIDARAAGTHFFPPAWKELRRITTNRQQHQVEGEEVKSTDGTRLKIDYRYSALLGREWQELPVGWYVFAGNPADPGYPRVSREAVIRAATTVREGDVNDWIQQAVESALEQAIGLLRDLQLLRPSENTATLPGLPIDGVDERTVTTVAELHTELSIRIRHRANRRLLPLGLGIVDFEITNLRYLDDQMQASLERSKRNELLARAATTYRNGVGAVTNLSDRELAVIGDPTFPEVTRAEATRFVAEQTASAVRGGAEAIGRGLEKIGEGLGS